MPDLNRELHSGLIRVLACPVCGTSLHPSESGQSLLCEGSSTTTNGRAGRCHCFDGAAGGYVSLAPHHSGGGDSKEAVRARTAFLTHGYYEKAADAIAAAVRDYTPADGLLLDAGCGEGYYSNRIAAAGYPVLGVDLSKFAVDSAARFARRIRTAEAGKDSMTLFAVGSVFELPVQDASFDTVTNIFAPCAPAEYARVLKQGGHLIVAGAGERHLFGLKERLYDDPYLNDPRRDLPTEADPFELVETRAATFTITVTGRERLEALFSMTPYYWRTGRDGQARLAVTDTLVTEVAFDLHIFRRV